LRGVAENRGKRGFILGEAEGLLLTPLIRFRKKVRNFRKTNKTLPSPKKATHPQSMKKQTKASIPTGVEQFLADTVSQAQRAADEAVVRFEAEQQPRPFPFDSVEEWHAFDAVLERWLQRNERPRRSDAA